MKNRINILFLGVLFFLAANLNAQVTIYQLDSVVTTDYDKDLDKFTYNGKLVFLYNNDGQIEEFTGYSNPLSGFPDLNTEYTYNAQGKISKEEVYQLDRSTSYWELISYIDYSFDGNNVLIGEETRESKASGGYVPTYKSAFVNNSNNAVETTTRYEWSKSAKDWEVIGKTEHSYNSDKLLTVELIYSWDAASSSWLKKEKEEALYEIESGLNFIETLSLYDWDKATTDWVLSLEIANGRKDNNDLEAKTMSGWNGSAPENYGLSFFMYDDAIPYEKMRLPYWYTKDANNHMVTDESVELYNKALDVYEVANERKFYYSAITTTSVNSVDDRDFTVYPNPATNSLTIESPKPIVNYSIVSLLGASVKEGSMLSENTIDVSNVEPGVYFIKTINSDDQSFTKKIIVK